MKNYTFILTFNNEAPKGEWRILDISEGGATEAMFDASKIVFRFPYTDEGNGTNVPPATVREKYEALVGRPEFINYDDPPEIPNLVEMIADEDECAWDQPCAFGYRVEHHAVYCHNEKWLYAPSKCRRHSGNSVWGDEAWPHDKCRGYKPNPNFKPVVQERNRIPARR